MSSSSRSSAFKHSGSSFGEDDFQMMLSEYSYHGRFGMRLELRLDNALEAVLVLCCGCCGPVALGNLGRWCSSPQPPGEEYTGLQCIIMLQCVTLYFIQRTPRLLFCFGVLGCIYSTIASFLEDYAQLLHYLTKSVFVSTGHCALMPATGLWRCRRWVFNSKTCASPWRCRTAQEASGSLGRDGEFNPKIEGVRSETFLQVPVPQS